MNLLSRNVVALTIAIAPAIGFGADAGGLSLDQIPCSKDEAIVLINGSSTPGTIVTSVGEFVSGQIGTLKICHGNGYLNNGGRVDWGTGGDVSSSYVGEPKWQGPLIAAQFSYKKSGTYNVTAKLGALCYYENKDPHGVQEASCGSGTATVYEGNPPKSIILSCGGTTPCTTVQGGKTISGQVILKQKSQDIGTLVRFSATANLTTVPYIIIDKNLNQGTFTIQTQAVTSNQNIALSATSGGFTTITNLQVTP